VRRLAFAVLVVAMASAAFLLGGHHEHRVEAPASTGAARIRRPPDVESAPSIPAPRRAAHRFIAAFLAIEAGGDGRATRAAIRRGAGGHLARDLLAHRPRRPTHPTARILALRVTPLPRHPDLALLTGTARRPDGPEPFAFLLALRGGRWLAIAPAE
jgi:hypothetical protein